jgi:hypothetical protein
MSLPINWVPAEKRYKYPHMSPSDVAIWERFLLYYPAFLGEVAYNVRVGQGQDPGTSYEMNIREMAVKLTQYRIDVLNKKDDNYFIIELKRDPGSGTIGQLISYMDLFKIDYPELRPVFPILICNRMTPDLRTVLTTNDVQFFVV